jgi:putative acetyltransferase
MNLNTVLHLVVRDERPEDALRIRKLNEAAFGRQDEADLIDGLRHEGVVLLSLVAEFDSKVIGHILFSRMTVETNREPLAAVSLAPMAVLPEHQRRGVGSQLVRRGLDALREQGERVVLVLGHEEYYPRFSFTPEKARYLANPFPPEAFMALELVDGALAGIRGTVKYPAAFGLGSAVLFS